LKNVKIEKKNIIIIILIKTTTINKQQMEEKYLYIHRGVDYGRVFNLNKIYIEKDKAIQATIDEPGTYVEIFILNRVKNEFEPTKEYYFKGVLDSYSKYSVKKT